MTNTTNNLHRWLGLLTCSLSFTNGISNSPNEELMLKPLSDSDKIFLENTMRDINMTDGSMRVEDILNSFMNYLKNKELAIIENESL